MPVWMADWRWPRCCHTTIGSCIYVDVVRFFFAQRFLWQNILWNGFSYIKLCDESGKKLSTIYRLAYKCTISFEMLRLLSFSFSSSSSSAYFSRWMHAVSLRRIPGEALNFHAAYVNLVNATFFFGVFFGIYSLLDHCLMLPFSNFWRFFLFHVGPEWIKNEHHEWSFINFSFGAKSSFNAKT